MHEVLKVAGVDKRIVLAGFCALLGACDVTGFRRPELTISVYADKPVATAYIFRVAVNGKVHDIALNTGFKGLSKIRTVGPRQGDRAVTAQLLTPPDSVIAHVAFTQAYRSGFRYWIAAYIGAHPAVGTPAQRLVERCGSAVFPLLIHHAHSSAQYDTVFVIQGGVPKDALCRDPGEAI